jgi:threonine synthase
MMLYESTRGKVKSISSAEAIKTGISSDGGLFLPESKTVVSLNKIENMISMNYKQRAIAILKYFIDDYSDDEISECVNKAYTDKKFDDIEIAPLHKLSDHVSVLELWHGPTCAFKDMALQILPHLLVKAVKKTGETNKIVILVATSGDTGKAALEGFKDVEGTEIIVFFPNNGVSEIQKMQMVTQGGKNVHSIAINGNFDDAQNGVKEIFSDSETIKLMDENGFRFSSANSINWGRLVPQIVYYFSAYCDLVKNGSIKLNEKINIVVPTGNFGNILAAYYAMQMGLPVGKLVCASNDNNVLTDFINTGIYNRVREFKKTVSPSMDILISSNLERLLFELNGHNPDLLNKWMEKLNTAGRYEIDPDTFEKVSKIFWAGFTTEAETLKTIESVYKDYNYVVDTHTAVAIDVYDKYVISTGDIAKAVIASTASPFKFNRSVVRAILGEDSIKGKSEFELLDILSEKCKIEVPAGLKGLEHKEIKHRTVCEKSEMKKSVLDILKIKQ